MKKAVIILILLAILFGGGMVINDRMKYTTYGEEIASLFDEDEIIDKINISNRFEKYSFIIEDEEIIKKVLEVPFNMELKEKYEYERMYYDISFDTNKNSFIAISVGKNVLHMDRDYNHIYKIVGDNILYRLIKDLDEEYKSNND